MYSSVNLVLYKATDFLVEAWRNWDIALNPRRMRDYWNVYGREEVFAKVAALRIFPCKAVLVSHHKVV